MTEGSRRAAQTLRIDLALAALLAAVTIVYIAALPHNLGVADESEFLNGARRIRDGEVLYRDIFYFTTPAGHWLMAGLFWLLGTTIEVARLTMAVVHGAIVATVYLLCRRLAVPAPLALAAAAAEVALCHAAWPYASLHWFGLLLILALARLAVGQWWRARPRHAAGLGLVTGMLLAVQQQKGALMALGVGALLVLLAAAERRAGSPAAGRVAVQRGLWFGAGVAVVMLPLLLILVAQVGVPPLVEQLVVFPLTGYRSLFHASWGQVIVLNIALSRYTIPPLLKYLPVVLPVIAARAAVLWVRNPAATNLPSLFALLTLSVAATVSVLYLPDFIHIAFIAPLYFVCWAETLAAGMRRLVASTAGQWAVATALGGAMLAGLGVQAANNRTRAWSEFPVPHLTAFGRVDFANLGEADLVDHVRTLFTEAGTRAFFAYPVFSSLYLTTGGRNPTLWQLMLPDYASPAQYQDAIATLDRRRVPYVFACAMWPEASDPMLHFILTHYERLDTAEQPCALYQRRDQPITGAS